MTFAEKLAKLRRGQNYTQEQFADILGVSRQSVSKWENGTAYPETEKLIKIAEMFDCSIDYLLKDSIEEPSPNPPAAPPPETRPKKKRWVIAAAAVAAIAVIAAVLVIIFIPRRATITIRSNYISNDGNEYEITYKQVGSAPFYPDYFETSHLFGDWDLNRRGYGRSKFGIVEVKNIKKGTIGSGVFVDEGFYKLYIRDNLTGAYLIFMADSCTANAPLTVKVQIDKSKGEYYKYYVREDPFAN